MAVAGAAIKSGVVPVSALTEHNRFVHLDQHPLHQRAAASVLLVYVGQPSRCSARQQYQTCQLLNILFHQY